MIRIGASCCKSLKMVVPEAKVVEARRFLIYPTEWYEISKKCIVEKKYLILTICIGRDDKLEYMPTESQWRAIIEDSTIKLISLGANWNNCRIDIINEPMKYTDKSTYTYLVNLAHNQINGRLPVGAGCEEFILAQAKGDMYPHLLRYGNFETLIIHIQGSCQNEVDCSKWTNLALNWAISHKKKIDCNEANMFDVATSSGYEKLLMQLKYAEKIGCKNFPVVFLNLDQSAFSQDTDKWKFLSFKVNGKDRTKYKKPDGTIGSRYDDFVNIINKKAPIPNIVEPIIIGRSKDGMIIPTQTINSYDKYLAQLENELLWQLGYLKEENITWSITQKTVDALKKFQSSIENKYPKIMVDGKCGRQMFRYLIQEISDSIERDNYRFALEIYASPTK